MKKGSNVWNELYQAAAALRDANPWKALTPKDLFGIQAEKEGEIHFCAFAESGKDENVFKGLTAYQGAAGLEFYQRIAQDQVDMLHMLWAQQGFQLQFVSRKEIDKKGYERIKESEIACKGKTSWPVFNVFASGRAETELQEEQAALIVVILKQVLAVVEAVKKDKKKAVLGNTEADCRYLVRTPSGRTWKNTYEFPPVVEPWKALSFTKKEQEKLKKEVGSASWELDGFYWPSLPQQTKEGIRLPFIWAVTDRGTGTPLGMEISYEPEGMKEGKKFLLQEFGKTDEFPARIAVKRPGLLEWLETAAKSLGIKVLLVQEVPGMIQIREELRNAEEELEMTGELN